MEATDLDDRVAGITPNSDRDRPVTTYHQRHRSAIAEADRNKLRRIDPPVSLS
jgi:hypothetical protein